MFKKSLGVNKFTSKRKIIGFNERNSNKFKPAKEKEVRIYNENVIKSKRDKTLKFTNFYSDNTDGSIINRMEDLGNNLDILRELNIENEVNFNNDRIKNIIKLFIDDFEIDDLGEDEVKKITLVDAFGMSGTVRVYFILSKNFESYEIIAIDLFHLLIPSSHRGKNKHQVLQDNYSKNRNNDKCISNYFKIDEN